MLKYRRFNQLGFKCLKKLCSFIVANTYDTHFDDHLLLPIHMNMMFLISIR